MPEILGNSEYAFGKLVVRSGGQELLFKVAAPAGFQSSKYADGGFDLYKF
jgi:hypothetical protein